MSGLSGHGFAPNLQLREADFTQPLDHRQAQSISPSLSRLLDTVRAIRASAEHLDVEASNHWSQQSTESLSHLTERLISDLLPCLAATELVVTPHLEVDVRNALNDAHQRIRQLAERLSIVRDAMSRSRGRSGTRPIHDALLTLRKSLDEVESLERAALCQLESSFSESELPLLAESLETAAAEARAHIVVITQPEPAPTDAYVLRKRPDLNRAYAKSLLDLDRPPRRGDQ